MVESGDWLTPYYNYEPRFEKPVLYYWLAAGAYLAAGPSPGAARLPSALAGLGLVLVTFYCARRWCGETEALLAGVIAATSAAGIAMAHQALPDLPLAFFVTAAVWTALVGLFDDPRGAPAPPSLLPWLAASALAAAARRAHEGARGSRAGRRRAAADRAAGMAPDGRLAARAAGPSARGGGGVPRRGRALVRRDDRRARRGVPLPLLRRGKPRALRHGALQRAAAGLVLPAHSRRRPAAVDAVHAAVGPGRDGTPGGDAPSTPTVSCGSPSGPRRRCCCTRCRSASSPGTSCRCCRRWPSCWRGA